MRKRAFTSNYIVLAFAIFLVATLISSCSFPNSGSAPVATPEPPHIETSTIITSLESDCGMKFKEAPSSNGNTRARAEDQKQIILVDTLSNGSQFVEAKVTIRPQDEQHVWFGYDSHVYNCIRALLRPMDALEIGEWYFKQETKEDVQITVNGVHASLHDEGKNIRSLMIYLVAQDTVPVQIPAAQPDLGSDCGQGVIVGLGKGRLNMRKNPGLNEAIIAKVYEGTQVHRLCNAEETHDSIVWIKVIIEGQNVSGWVSKEFVHPV